MKCLHLTCYKNIEKHLYKEQRLKEVKNNDLHNATMLNWN